MNITYVVDNRHVSIRPKTDDTWSVTIVGNPYSLERHYYDPGNNSSKVANPKKQKVT